MKPDRWAHQRVQCRHALLLADFRPTPEPRAKHFWAAISHALHSGRLLPNLLWLRRNNSPGAADAEKKAQECNKIKSFPRLVGSLGRVSILEPGHSLSLDRQ